MGKSSLELTFLVL